MKSIENNLNENEILLYIIVNAYYWKNEKILLGDYIYNNDKCSSVNIIVIKYNRRVIK